MIAATQSNHPLGAVSGSRTTGTVLSEACNRIRTAGMRVTKPRVTLVETLLKLDVPASIERIHQQVGIKTCDLVTIYRCLAAFENIGLVRRSYLHNGTCLYEQTLGGTRHYHIVCKSCGKADPVDYTLAEGVEERLHDKGYAQISHVVEFFGVCLDCQRAAKNTQRGTPVEVPSDP